MPALAVAAAFAVPCARRYSFKPRRILLVSADRAERGLQEPIMKELQKIETVEAKWCNLDSRADVHDNLAKFGTAVFEFGPDIVMVPTDRSEIVYIAAYAFHQGLVVAHFHAGNNLTNHPDDLNRRAISCFSHILFCNMPEHRENLINQGEEPWRIHVVGSTAFDIELDDSMTPKEPYALVILHPDPLSREETEKDLQRTFECLKSPSVKTVIWIYPNADRNRDIIAKCLDNLSIHPYLIRFHNLPRSQYLSVLKNCDVAIGNSSSFHYELPVLAPNTKFLQIGNRDKDLIVPKTKPGGSKRIAQILATVRIDDKLRRKTLVMK